ncbi:hypothetical protein [Plasmodium yoelii yoelii]|uniref:Uncharacterized protein n=1 Tax=Plasmodium yoelii yoelii TaxID=73239 RepID=Q7RBP9_PLAYO|nr:hypothetical protein [Plasmodium yoelii yoelii]
MASANIIDHNRKNKKYFENKMVESANLFQAEIDSEDDIRNGKIKKAFVNLIGYIVEKRKDHIYIIYIESMTKDLFPCIISALNYRHKTYFSVLKKLKFGGISHIFKRFFILIFDFNIIYSNEINEVIR